MQRHLIERHDLQAEYVRTSFRVENHALEDREFGGLASATNVLIESFPPTIIMPGAFANTIVEDRDRISLLWSHNMDEIIGTVESLRETEEGLMFQARLTEGVQRADEAIALLRDGAAREVSIGWMPVETSFRENELTFEVVRLVHKLRLLEISIVSMGANPGNSVREVNALYGAADTQALFEFEKHVREGRRTLVPASTVAEYHEGPIAERGAYFDGAQTRRRLDRWRGDTTHAYLLQDAEGVGILPVFDLNQGELHLIPRAIESAVEQVREGTISVEGEDATALRRLLNRYSEDVGAGQVPFPEVVESNGQAVTPADSLQGIDDAGQALRSSEEALETDDIDRLERVANDLLAVVAEERNHLEDPVAVQETEDLELETDLLHIDNVGTELEGETS